MTALSQRRTPPCSGGIVVYVWLVLPCTTGAGRCPAGWERRLTRHHSRDWSTQPGCSRDPDSVLDRFLGDHPFQDDFLWTCRPTDVDVSRRLPAEPEVFRGAGHLSLAAAKPARRCVPGGLCRDQCTVPID